MKSRGIGALLCGVALFASCSRVHQEDPRLYARVAELEDSLKVYRDSLRDVQTYWTFNRVTAIVKLENKLIRLGDSCRFDVFVGASNSPGEFPLPYRHGGARLELNDRPNANIIDNEGQWSVAFKPEHLGADSIVGSIWLEGVRGGPVELMFVNYCNVVK